MLSFPLVFRKDPTMYAGSSTKMPAGNFFPVITLTPTEHKQLDFTNDFKILNSSYTLANTDGNFSLRNFAKTDKV